MRAEVRLLPVSAALCSLHKRLPALTRALVEAIVAPDSITGELYTDLGLVGEHGLKSRIYASLLPLYSA